MSDQWVGRIMGCLFLAALAVSIPGNLLLLGVLNAEIVWTAAARSEQSMHGASLLLLFNSVFVASIGVLGHGILERFSKRVALAYLAIRLIEATVLAVAVVAVVSLAAVAGASDAATRASDRELLASFVTAFNWYAYHAAMIALGLGSLPFCLLLLRHQLVPGPLALLGLLAYAILGLSSMLAVLDFDAGVFVTLPVLVFEVSLGLYLVARGFRLESAWPAYLTDSRPQP